MKNAQINILSLIVIFLVFTSCKKKSIEPFLEEPINIQSLVVGSIEDAIFSRKAMLWVNGERTEFLDQFVEGNSQAVDIQVENNDIYIIINDRASNTSKVIKNGDIIFETSPDINASFNNIFVKNGNVYVCGISVLNNSASATIWENGTIIQLDTLVSNALSVWVDQDIYVCGLVSDGITSRAAYWKNGERITLNQSDFRSNATDIKVFNNQVHVIGKGFDQSSLALYWIDNIEYELSDSLSFYNLNSILVRDNGLSILGEDSERDVIKVLDNNSFTLLSNVNEDSYAIDQIKFNDEIYTLGGTELKENSDSTFIKIWRGNEEFLKFYYDDSNDYIEAFSAFSGDLNYVR